MGHLIDFDHSKVTQRFEPQVIGNHQRIEESLRQALLKYFEESVISRAEEMMGDPDHAHEYLSRLKIGKVCTRPLSFDDLGWCKEVRACPPFEKPTDVCF